MLFRERASVLSRLDRRTGAAPRRGTTPPDATSVKPDRTIYQSIFNCRLENQ